MLGGCISCSLSVVGFQSVSQGWRRIACVVQDGSGSDSFTWISCCFGGAIEQGIDFVNAHPLKSLSHRRKDFIKRAAVRVDQGVQVLLRGQSQMHTDGLE
jgi:hypothetical protein